MQPPDDARLDRICGALADPTRRRIYVGLGTSPGLTTAELAAGEPRLTRWAVMKHLAVLREAGLVQTLPEGRRRRHYRDERGTVPLEAWLATARERP